VPNPPQAESNIENKAVDIPFPENISSKQQRLHFDKTSLAIPPYKGPKFSPQPTLKQSTSTSASTSSMRFPPLPKVPTNLATSSQRTVQSNLQRMLRSATNANSTENTDIQQERKLKYGTTDEKIDLIEEGLFSSPPDFGPLIEWTFNVLQKMSNKADFPDSMTIYEAAQELGFLPAGKESIVRSKDDLPSHNINIYLRGMEGNPSGPDSPGSFDGFAVQWKRNLDSQYTTLGDLRDAKSLSPKSCSFSIVYPGLAGVILARAMTHHRLPFALLIPGSGVLLYCNRSDTFGIPFGLSNCDELESNMCYFAHSDSEAVKVCRTGNRLIFRTFNGKVVTE
jgi:hypothetical protein